MVQPIYADRFDSPVGELGVAVDSEGRLVRLAFLAGGVSGAFAEPALAWRSQPCAQARRQLLEYFARRRKSFELDVHLEGPAFERRVWEELRRIPYGETLSYGKLARRVASPEAAQAIGQANHRNPVAIVIPCHRVVAADGTLVGFGGGIATQRALLDLERGQRTFA